VRRTGECATEAFLALGKRSSPKFSISVTGERLDVEVLDAVGDSTNSGGVERRRESVNQRGSEIGAKKDWLGKWNSNH
jgi:hypothetical protein